MKHCDIWLLVVLVSCGGGATSSEPDAASTIDAPSDSVAPQPDASESSVRIEARSIDGPLPGVTIAILDTSDAVVAVTTTGSDGSATSAVAPGGSVLAVSPAKNRVNLRRAVEAGDVLRVRFDVATATHQVTVTVPPSTIADFRVATRCGTSDFTRTTTTTLTLPVSCTTSPLVMQHFELALWSHSTYVPAQSLSGATIDLSSLPQSRTVEYLAEAVGIPSTVTRIEIVSSIRVGELFVGGEVQTVLGNPSDGRAAMNASVPDVPGLEVVNRITTTAGSARQVVFSRGTVAAPPPRIDAGERLVVVASPSYSAATRRITWLQSTTGDSLDAVRGSVRFNADLTWDIVAPPATSVRIPLLPAALADIDPGSRTVGAIQVRGYNLPDGYERVRSMLFDTTSPDELVAPPAVLRVSESIP